MENELVMEMMDCMVDDMFDDLLFDDDELEMLEWDNDDDLEEDW